MFATSSGSSLGSDANQASRISSSRAGLVVRSDSASTLASFHLRAPRAVSASPHSAARIPWTLLAAIEAPVPVQQQTMPCSARPSATSRAAASLPHAQSSRSPSASAPWTIGSCPRRRSSSTTALATPAFSSAATEIFIGSHPSLGLVPELPEVEITARRLNSALSRRTVESALAPGMVTMKTFDPPLDALAGREITAVRRAGKMPIVELGDVSLLIHLMSAGRLQLFDTRASLRDKRSRLLVRIAPESRELRLREFGTQQRAWAKLLPSDAIDTDEAVATLGPEAWPAPPL